jgi:hypothetical protein
LGQLDTVQAAKKFFDIKYANLRVSRRGMALPQSSIITFVFFAAFGFAIGTLGAYFHFYATTSTSNLQESERPCPTSFCETVQQAAQKPLPYAECVDAVRALGKTKDPLPDPNWKEINSRPKVQQLIQEAGGMTPVIQAFMHTYESKAWGKGSGAA